MIIKRSTELKEDFIPAILKLDEKVYAADLTGSYRSVKERYDANKDSYLLAIEEATKEIIGYLCFFPITTELKENMKRSDVMIDDIIKGSDIIPYEQGKKHTVYIISVVVHPNYKGKGVSRLLTQALVDFIQEKAALEITIEELLATAVSIGGKNLLQHLDFQEEKTLDGGYTLFSKKQD